MCTTLPQSQDHKEPAQYEQPRQASVTAEIRMLCCINLLTVAHAFRNYEPI